MDFPRSLPKYSSPLGSFPDYSLPGASALTSVLGWVITQNGGFSLILASNLSSSLTIDDISQITSRSHTSLTNIGTLAHATIDSYLDQAVKVASSPRFSALGIGTAPSYPLHIVDAMSTDAVDYSIYLNLAVTGVKTGRLFGAMRFDIDYAGTISGTPQFNAIENYLTITGAGDAAAFRTYYGYLLNQSSEDIATLNAGYFRAVHSGSGTVSTLRGNLFVTVANSSGPVTTMQGIYAQAGSATGFSSTIDTVHAVRANILQQAGTIITGYLFYGDYTGTVGTKWGVYCTGETNNYLSGSLLIGSTTSLATLAAGIVFGAGTAPTAILANGVGLWCEDIAAGAGKSGLHMMSESGTEKLIVAGVIYKTDTGDPAQVHEGLLEINTFDNKVKMYADGAWRELGTW